MREKYENVGLTLDTGPTFSTVTEMQAEAEKAQQTYEEIESLEDSHIVSFPKLDKEKEALRRKTQGERVPFETGDILTSLTNITEPPPIAFTDASDFDEVLKEGDEYLSKIEEELENEGRKQILSRVEKGFAKTVKWETINFPLQQLMKFHLRLPFPHAPKVLSRNPKMWVNKTPILEHPAVLIAIPEWESRYGTKSYAVDVKEGYIYAVRSEDWERLVERAYVATDEPLESNQVTPMEREASVGKVQTLDSKERVPMAESTRKDLKEPILKGKGIPGIDFLDSGPRHKVPDKEIETPKRKLSFEDSTDDEQLAKEIEKDIKDAEQAQWALETERMQIEAERATLEKERQRIAEERLKALRQQRKRLEESIIKMSNEMSRDIDLVTEDRKQRRINMENEYLNQIDLEEAAVDDYFPVLTRVEDIQPDVMTTDSQISSTVDPIEFMDEEALMKLKLKHMRADQCRTRTHKMYKLFLESATDSKKKESLEHMLLATINSLDRKMSKFKEGLDDYDQKEQYVLIQTERLQLEQEKALQEQRQLQEVLQGLQEKHKVAEGELKALQKEKDDSDKRKKEMEDKISQERKAKIWREQRLEEERQKLKELDRIRKEKGSWKGEKEEDKRIREHQDGFLAERLAEKEKREREIKDKNLAEQLQKKQRLERDEQEKLLTEQLLEKERQEEEEMIRIKEEQEQLDREEQVRLEEERQFNLTEKQKRLQRKELERLRKKHLKTLEREKREKEKKQAQGKARKPTEEEQKQEKENLLDALHSVVNGNKPSKPKDLGWDYQKDKEAKRVFERKKELQKLREKEKERKSKQCPECRYPKHPGPCPCKLCGKKGHEFKDCPKSKPPKEIPEQTIEFCIECMVPHPTGRCICKLCKTVGHTATECPWLEEAEATTKPPKTDEKDKEPEILFCLHCRSETHRIEDCAAYKVAQAKRKKVWCERCKQYGHTMADCLDEKQEQRDREIDREILKRKQQLEEIDRKMHQVKKQAERDIGKPPQDRDTRDYPVGGRKPVTKPRKSDREPEPPPSPREGPPSGPPVGAGGGGGEPPEGDDPSDPDDSDSDESDEEESDSTEATEESGFLYDEKGRKIDIGQFYEALRKRKKRTV